MPWTEGAFLASDALLPCLVLLSLALLSLRLSPYGYPLANRSQLANSLFKSVGGASSGPFSLERAVAAYSRYEELAQWDIRQMRRSYGKIGRAHKRMGYDLGYTKKLNRLSEVIAVNAEVTTSIARFARTELDSPMPSYALDGGDLGRVREALKHFVRDWSEEGLEERSRIFGPILGILQLVDCDQRQDKKVLVPGCGLGRLAWEISQFGRCSCSSSVKPLFALLTFV